MFPLGHNPVLEGGGWPAPRFGHLTPGKDTVRLVREARWALLRPFIPGKGTVHLVHEAGWASGPVWTR